MTLSEFKQQLQSCMTSWCPEVFSGGMVLLVAEVAGDEPKAQRWGGLVVELQVNNAIAGIVIQARTTARRDQLIRV